MSLEEQDEIVEQLGERILQQIIDEECLPEALSDAIQNPVFYYCIFLHTCIVDMLLQYCIVHIYSTFLYLCYTYIIVITTVRVLPSNVITISLITMIASV